MCLIATVPRRARRLGPTAPYGYASWMLVEAGDRQPRSLAEAFRKPCRASVDEAEQAVHAHLDKLDKLDKTYQTGEVAAGHEPAAAADPEWQLAPVLRCRRSPSGPETIVREGTA